MIMLSLYLQYISLFVFLVGNETTLNIDDLMTMSDTIQNNSIEYKKNKKTKSFGKLVPQT